jgi:hypothetical protein
MNPRLREAIREAAVQQIPQADPGSVEKIIGRAVEHLASGMWSLGRRTPDGTLTDRGREHLQEKLVRGAGAAVVAHTLVDDSETSVESVLDDASSGSWRSAAFAEVFDDADLDEVDTWTLILQAMSTSLMNLGAAVAAVADGDSTQARRCLDRATAAAIEAAERLM